MKNQAKSYRKPDSNSMYKEQSAHHETPYKNHPISIQEGREITKMTDTKIGMRTGQFEENSSSGRAVSLNRYPNPNSRTDPNTMLHIYSKYTKNENIKENR